MSANEPSGIQLRHRRVVVKVGTSLLTAGSDRIAPEAIEGIAGQLAALHALGGEAIVVSSGAIAAGRQRLAGVASARNVQSRQALAAIGQSHVMALWSELLAARGLTAAQALLTRRDLADRLGYLNARNTLLTLLDLGVVPVVNENDVVAVEEIRDSVIGDNDNLSAQVANLVDADLLLMLTDVDGLYTAHPATHPEARLIEHVERIDAEIERAAGAAGEGGIGGMVTKVQAARIATQSGTHVVIADGREPDVLLTASRDEPAGTHFEPTGDRTESRRRYLFSALGARGRVIIDDGAVRALERDGTSLLPAGVLTVEGDFARGDVVHVETAEHRRVASGTVNYDAADIRRILGLRSDRITEVLGYEYGEEIVHRSNLVLV